MTDQKSPLTLRQVETRAWAAKNERREKMATAILAGASSGFDSDRDTVDAWVKRAVEFTEALMTRLDKVAEETKP